MIDAAALLDATAVAMRVSTSAGAVLHVNTAWCALTGLSAPASLDQGWLSAIVDEDRPLAAAPRTTDAIEYRVRTADGLRRVRDHAVVVASSDGADPLVVHTVVPVTMVEPARWAHELRGPLNAIQGWADLLASSPQDDAVVRRGLDAIASNARAQAAIIARMTG